jgi:hypothetical protein
MTNELMVWSHKNWLALPELRRDAVVDHLTAVYGDRVKDLHRAFSEDLLFHLGAGMHLRNMCRNILLDHQLPAVRQPDGRMGQNWDDYYLGAMGELFVRAGIWKSPTPA